MKQLYTFTLLVIAKGIIAQAPQSIPYQDVVKKADGSVLLAKTAVTIASSIQKRIYHN